MRSNLAWPSHFSYLTLLLTYFCLDSLNTLNVIFHLDIYQEADILIYWFSQPREKIEGTPPELRQGLFTSSPGTPSPDLKTWSAFPEEPKAQAAVKSVHPRSVRTLRASNSNKASSLGQSNISSSTDPFAFGQDSFKAAPSGTALPQLSNMGSTSQLNSLNVEEKKDGSYQPAGWTGF